MRGGSASGTSMHLSRAMTNDRAFVAQDYKRPTVDGTQMQSYLGRRSASRSSATSQHRKACRVSRFDSAVFFSPRLSSRRHRRTGGFHSAAASSAPPDSGGALEFHRASSPTKGPLSS